MRVVDLWLAVLALALAFPGARALGQAPTPGAPAAPSPAGSVPSALPGKTNPAGDPSSLASRLEVARTVRVITSILEVGPGMSVDEAREKLDPLADPKTPPKQEGGEMPGKKEGKDDDDDDANVSNKTAADAVQKRAHPKDDDDDEGETKILWKLKEGSPYQWVFIKAGQDDKITAVFGYCWPDKPIPFEQIGDVSKAPIHSPEQVAWDSVKPPLHYRVIADGTKEHAAQVSIFFAATRTNGVHQAKRRE